jgi:hypothetical protein
MGTCAHVFEWVYLLSIVVKVHNFAYVISFHTDTLLSVLVAAYFPSFIMDGINLLLFYSSRHRNVILLLADNTKMTLS